MQQLYVAWGHDGRVRLGRRKILQLFFAIRPLPRPKKMREKSNKFTKIELLLVVLSHYATLFFVRHCGNIQVVFPVNFLDDR